MSVVLPVYNGERYLEETLRSVLNQRGFRDLEVVVIDDGSTDGSAAIIERIPDSRIRLLRQENRGIPATRNRAIRESRGRYIAFTDQDDLWHPDKLATQIPAFTGRPEVGLGHCQSARIDENSEPISEGPVVLRSRMRGDVRRGMLVGNLVPGTAGVVVRRECFDEVGLFDESLGGADDWDMWSRIAARYEFHYVSEVLSYTRLHGANTSLDIERMRDVSLRVREKLFRDPRMTRGIGPGELRALHRRGTARIHAYSATWLIRTGRTREAARHLMQAVLNDPTKPRHIILLLFAAIGWMPDAVRNRLI